ncbi:hypothetical protein DRN79_01455 [Methanosarcinales archaeon]|nr:MAG: hypothetical protein DRN79_01455 [Methanosarcinales archaeon]
MLIEEFTPFWNVSERDFKRRLQERLLRRRERGDERASFVFVAGFPPVGNLVPFNLKEHIDDSVEIMRFYSYNFPPVVEMHDDVFEIPHDELWFSEEKGLFMYVGKYPEVEYIPKASYKQAEILAKTARELFIEELYTIGVIVLLPEERERMGDAEAFIASFSRKSKEIPHGIRKMTRREMGSYTILRKTGLLPGFASKLNIDSYAILGVGSRPNDVRACIRALRAFKNLTDLNIDIKNVEEALEKNAKIIEERLHSTRPPSTSTTQSTQPTTHQPPSPLYGADHSQLL